MQQNNYLVIMAGGVGTRFWPMSRNSYPKQFLDVLGTGKTLLQQTVERFGGIVPEQNIYIVTSQEYTQLVKDQLPYIADSQVLAEPYRRNTAPCIAYACYKIACLNPQANVIISPADHIVLKESVFKQKIETCLAHAASTDNLVTLGIQPTRPDTGYGYIKFEENNTEIYKVEQFLEKPNLALAQQFVQSGQYLWNAGIFIWNLSTFQKAFAQLVPDIAEPFKKGMSYFFTDEEPQFIENLYQHCPNISIDYALLEKAQNVDVVPADVAWSDLGTWRSLHEAAPKDQHNNSLDGNIQVFDTQNSIIKTPEGMLVMVQGLNGHIVVQHQNALLICKIDDEQRVKEFVEIAKNIDQKFI
jgi:mannose-1-phosphate guanylyltransferase